MHRQDIHNTSDGFDFGDRLICLFSDSLRLPFCAQYVQFQFCYFRISHSQFTIHNSHHRFVLHAESLSKILSAYVITNINSPNPESNIEYTFAHIFSNICCYTITTIDQLETAVINVDETS